MTLDEMEKTFCNRMGQEEAVLAVQLMPKMIKALKEAKTMRFYCLGSDCSTQNMLERFDKAIADLEQP